MSEHPFRRFRWCAFSTLAVATSLFACNAISGADRIELEAVDAGGPVSEGPETGGVITDGGSQGDGPANDGPTTEPDGQSPAEPAVTFDAKGARDYGNETVLSWSHTFGANANAVVISVSHESASAPAIKVGSTTVPVLSGPTFTGSYLTYSAYHTMAAVLLRGVAGSTQTVTVTFSSTRASSATSLSFDHVGSLGSVVTNGGGSGSGNASAIVNSSVRSMVAVGFGGTATNFSDFNKTAAENFSFNPYVTWSHLIGYARGASGLQFTASVAGDWQGKAIELRAK